MREMSRFRGNRGGFLTGVTGVAVQGPRLVGLGEGCGASGGLRRVRGTFL